MLGPLLRKARRNADLTMKEMAQCLGVTFQYVSLVEKEKRIPTDEILETWRKVLQLPLDRVRRAKCATLQHLELHKVRPRTTGSRAS